MTDVPITNDDAGPDEFVMGDMLDHVLRAPWVLVVARDIPGDSEGLKVELHIGGGISSTSTVTSLLAKTLGALPPNGGER